MNNKPKLSTYHAIINQKDPNGVHGRTSIEAKDAQEARSILKEQFGSVSVVSLREEWEASQARGET